jgi:hypothetical protein
MGQISGQLGTLGYNEPMARTRRGPDGGELMTCKSCSSENQQKFSSEIIVHFAGLKNLNMPPVFVFPKLLVCLDCGFTEFVIPETEVCLLGEGSSAQGAATRPTQGWNFDLTEVTARLPFRCSEAEVREPGADKPLAMKDGFYRH